MFSSRSLLASLTAISLFSTPAMSASSDTIISVGLLGSSSGDLAFSFDTKVLLQVDGTLVNELTTTDLLPNNDIALDVAQKESQILAENLWSQSPANLSDYSVYVQSPGQDSMDTAIVDIEASTEFNFNWENRYQPRESLLRKGLKQYLALEDKADFDFSILKPRVIHISADPLEYSIMNDLCFIKKCFF